MTDRLSGGQLEGLVRSAQKFPLGIRGFVRASKIKNSLLTGGGARRILHRI